MNDTNNQADKDSARTLEGRVTSSKASKTVTVLVDRQEQHGLYGKLLRRSIQGGTGRPFERKKSGLNSFDW